MLTLSNLKDIARKREDGYRIEWWRYEDVMAYHYEGKVQPKERPRSTKGGKMFTPPATREFEKKIKDWAKKHKMKSVSYPIRVDLTILEASDDEQLVSDGKAGLTYRSVGDVDNMAKAVLDGLNKIAYKDDRQIVSLGVSRVWNQYSGFDLVLARNGMTKQEYETYRNIVRKLQ